MRRHPRAGMRRTIASGLALAALALAPLTACAAPAAAPGSEEVAAQLLTDCLVRNQAVPFAYSVADYLEDAPHLTFPFVNDRGPELLAHCNDDPNYGR